MDKKLLQKLRDKGVSFKGQHNHVGAMIAYLHETQQAGNININLTHKQARIWVDGGEHIVEPTLAEALATFILALPPKKT